MTRRLTALFSALEALLVVGVGIGIPLVPSTLLWAVQYGLEIDWSVFWRGAVDGWLLGHGVDIRFTLDPLTAAGTGLPGAGEPFVVTIAPLAFALITLLLGMRAGRRIGETPHRHLGHLVAVGMFALLALGVTASALDPMARPSLVQGALLPTLVFALGVAIGSAVSRSRLTPEERSAAGRSARFERFDLSRFEPTYLVGRLGPASRAALASAATAARGGGAAVAMLLAASAVATAALVAVHYGEIIALYEGVQSGYLGGAALTVAQLAVLPNLVVWAAAWFVGPGFAIGTGTAVSPLGTALGPLPAVPVFGALPTGDLAWGFLGLLVPVLAGFVSAVILGSRLSSGAGDRGEAARWGPVRIIGTGLGMGLCAGVTLGALAWMASGSAGPGRLADVGAPWFSVALWCALEVGIPAVMGLLLTRGSLAGGSLGSQPEDEPRETDSAGMSDSRNSAVSSHPSTA
ncbi:MAG: hypothetical protein RI885_224 [Actinomycetota bacterium]|jgi:hypothetical protein